jgi:hypothetical protein
MKPVIGSGLVLGYNLKETGMANRQQRGNREAKKPKKEKIKTVAAPPSQKGSAWQPAAGSTKKK